MNSHEAPCKAWFFRGLDGPIYDHQVMLVMVLATVLLVYTAVGSPVKISWELWEKPKDLGMGYLPSGELT